MYQHHYFEFPFDKIVAFMEYLKNEKYHYSMIRGGRRIVCLGRSLMGQPLNTAESTILDKFLIACFNDNPPINRKLAETWDVSILLDHFIKMGPNESLSFSDISGKLFLLLLLTQMCRTTEVLQLDLSQLQVFADKLQFILIEPTKTFNRKNYAKSQGLQRMPIRKLEGNKLLCPMTTLLAYMERTKDFRQKITKLFILITSGPPHPVSKASLIWWSRIIMKSAGLGKFTMHSTHSASASSGLVMGIPFDELMSKVGWQRASTFISSYMKPLLDKKRAAMPQLKAPSWPRVRAPEENVIKTAKTNPKKSKKLPIPTPPPIIDRHNFKSVFDDKTPKLLGAGSMAQVTNFLKRYKKPVGPVYAPIQTPEHSITLSDVKEVIRNDKDHPIDLKSPAYIEGDLQGIILHVLSPASSLPTPTQEFQGSPQPGTPDRIHLSNQVSGMSSWDQAQGQEQVTSEATVIRTENSTYTDEVMSPDSDRLVIASPSSVCSDLAESQGGYELRDEEPAPVFKVPEVPLVKLPPKLQLDKGRTFEQEYREFVSQPPRQGVLLDTPNGPVEFEIGVMTERLRLLDMEHWGPPPYDEPYWPGYETETNFLSRHLISPELYPIVYPKGRNPEPILLGNEITVLDPPPKTSTHKRKLGGAPRHAAVHKKFGEVTDHLVEMAVRNELTKNFLPVTVSEDSEPEVQITRL